MNDLKVKKERDDTVADNSGNDVPDTFPNECRRWMNVG